MRRTAILLALLAAGSVRPGATRADDDPQPFVVAAFEDDADPSTVFASGSALHYVPGKHGQGTRCLRWEITSDLGLLSFSRVPPDLREYRTLRLRIRAARPTEEAVHVRFVSAGAASLRGFLPEVPEAWGKDPPQPDKR